MERRSFIKGMLLSAAAGEAVVKLATVEEMQALVPQREVILGHPSPDYFFPGDAFGMEVYAKFRDGSYMPIGYLTSVQFSQNVIEAGTAWDGTVQLVPGLMRGSANFKGFR